MKKIEFTEEMVESYYLGQYANDLPKYFKFETRGGRHMILDVDLRHSYYDRTPGSPSGHSLLFCPSGNSLLLEGPGSTGKNFIFAGLFSYMILTQQAIHAICGEEAQENFHKASGWPWISAGMAGPYYSFRKMLEEAVLYPELAEMENFAAMLEIVKKVMNKEMEEFLTAKNANNLNQTAYRALLAAASGKTDDIIQHITAELDSLITDLQTDASDR